MYIFKQHNIDTKEPYYAQIRKLISKIITGSEKSRNVATQEQVSSWFIPDTIAPHVVSPEDGSENLQEGNGQATTTGGPPTLTGP